MIFLLDFRSKDVGGGVTAGVLSAFPNGPDGEAALDQLRQAARVTIATHGFNVNRKKGRVGLSNLAQFLDHSESHAVVATLWPGDSVLRFLSYPVEGKTADDTAKALARFIFERNAISPGTPLSIVTHSLGARVGMETVERMLGRDYPVEQVCLMAAAIVDYTLARPKDYREATESCDRVAVLASKKDRVVKWAFPVGNLLEVFPLFRKDSIGWALGYHGPRSAKGGRQPVPDNVIHEQIPKRRKSRHGDYIPDFTPTSYPGNPDGHEKNRKSAVTYAASVLKADENPTYPE